MPSLILMGIKHCGKSTQGKLLGRELDMPFYDTDDLIVKKSGKTPRQIYSEGGEEAFKSLEYEVCRELTEKLKKTRTDAVIATGGGFCNNQAAVSILRTLGHFVFLVADERTAADRIVREVTVNEDGTLSNMPAYIAKKNPQSLKDVRNIFHEFYCERVEIYSQIADMSVHMGNAPKAVNTAIILESLKDLSRNTAPLEDC